MTSWNLIEQLSTLTLQYMKMSNERDYMKYAWGRYAAEDCSPQKQAELEAEMAKLYEEIAKIGRSL